MRKGDEKQGMSGSNEFSQYMLMLSMGLQIYCMEIAFPDNPGFLRLCIRKAVNDVPSLGMHKKMTS